MTINELSGLIRERGSHNKDTGSWYLDGCDMLEYISDVPGFVSLLRRFRRGGISFVDYYPEPIGVMLNGDVLFRAIGGFVQLITNSDICFYWEA